MDQEEVGEVKGENRHVHRKNRHVQILFSLTHLLSYNLIENQQLHCFDSLNSSLKTGIININ